MKQQTKPFFCVVVLWMLAMLPSFIHAAVDKQASALAEKTLQAMGGREAYNNTRYLTWRFFGGRLHVWDKYTGQVRIEDGKGLVIVMNVNTMKGEAWQNEKAVANADALAQKLETGYKWWINDSYWLVMPYKLLDPGVNLVFSGEAKTEDGRVADILTMTFNEVGVTPENKYEVFIDRETQLVSQWRFFRKATDAEAAFTTAWTNWEKYGNIWLSADRGNNKRHTDVAVLDVVPMATFTSPKPLIGLVN